MHEHLQQRPCRCAACQALVRAVPAVVTEVGILQATVEDLAGAVGMTASTVRRHASLDELIATYYLASAAELHERMFSGFDGRTTWTDGVRRGVAGVFEAANADPDQAAFCFREVPQAAGTLRDTREGVRLTSLLMWRQNNMMKVAERAQLGGPRIERFHGALLNRLNVSLRRDALHELDDDVVEELVALAT